MEKKTQGIILFLILIIYRILYAIFYDFVPSNFSFIIQGIWIVLIIIFVYWLSKKTDFFKKQDSLKSTTEHRSNVLEQIGFYSVMVYLGYILGVICFGIGVFGLFSSNPNALKNFSFMIILGSFIILIMFLIARTIKKNQK
jgi:hypothetical protein